MYDPPEGELEYDLKEFNKVATTFEKDIKESLAGETLNFVYQVNNHDIASPESVSDPRVKALLEIISYGFLTLLALSSSFVRPVACCIVIPIAARIAHR